MSWLLRAEAGRSPAALVARIALSTRLPVRGPSPRVARLLVSALLLVAVGVALTGCVVVPQNRRQYLADPTMQTDPLEARARDKLHTSREAASGGNGQPAGGGCGCGN